MEEYMARFTLIEAKLSDEDVNRFLRHKFPSSNQAGDNTIKATKLKLLKHKNSEMKQEIVDDNLTVSKPKKKLQRVKMKPAVFKNSSLGLVAINTYIERIRDLSPNEARKCLQGFRVNESDIDIFIGLLNQAAEGLVPNTISVSRSEPTSSRQAIELSQQKSLTKSSISKPSTSLKPLTRTLSKRSSVSGFGSGSARFPDEKSNPRRSNDTSETKKSKASSSHTKSESKSSSLTATFSDLSIASESTTNNDSTKHVVSQEKTETVMKSNDSSADPLHHSIKVLWSSRYDSLKTMHTLLTSSLKGIDEKLLQFQIGKITGLDLVHSLINALFHRDHSTGKHWDYDGSRCSKISNDESGVTFKCESSATWDWKDIYAVASAEANIKILASNHEIHIEDYSYYCAG
jgi:hypothetical protein